MKLVPIIHVVLCILTKSITGVISFAPVHPCTKNFHNRCSTLNSDKTNHDPIYYRIHKANSFVVTDLFELLNLHPKLTLIPFRFSIKSLKKCLSSLALSSAIALTCLFIPYSVLAEDTSPNIHLDQITLQPPSEDHPIISLNQFSTHSSPNKEQKNPQEQIPLVQGLLYISDHRELLEEKRQDDSQMIIISVSTFSPPNIIVAGAKIPLKEITRFPVQVQLGEKNIRPNLSRDERAQLVTQDLRVSAKLCSVVDSIENNKIPCEDPSTVSFESWGIAKVLNAKIFGPNAEEGWIRAPFSLPLGYIK